MYMGHEKHGQCFHAWVKDAPKILGHGSHSKWAVGARIVLSGKLRVTYWLLMEEERRKWSWYWFGKKIMMIKNDYLVWFSARWMKQNMCASCRILHDPIVIRHLLWLGNMPSLSIGSESTRVYARKATDCWIFLRSYLDFPMCVRVPMIVSTILQSSRWWISRVGIPHTTWHICRSPDWHKYQIGMGRYPI